MTDAPTPLVPTPPLSITLAHNPLNTQFQVVDITNSTAHMPGDFLLLTDVNNLITAGWNVVIIAGHAI